MPIQRTFTTIISEDLAKSRDFYVQLFGFRVDFDSDWFVHLQSPKDESLELGFLRRDHDIVPDKLRRSPAGTMIVIVVDDVDALHRTCNEAKVPVIEAPRDLFYGQRRMLLEDPNGVIVDVSSECEPSAEFMASLSPG